MKDTIAAISTGSVRSAIGIIRLSGPETFSCIEKVFSAKAEPRRAVYGALRDRDGNIIDNCLCLAFPAPHSYTGEDCAELQCHGSPMLLTLALEALFAAGARQAEAGEFTKRAFLNGKLDLAQAEAVIDLIDAETPLAARNAAGQLGGALSRRLAEINDSIMSVVSHFQAEVDYPDEGVDPFTTDEAVSALREAVRQTDRLCAGFKRGQIMKEGLVTALIGRPNVGKSSVLNALAGYERAIVTPTAGTTRDSIEETVVLGDILLRLNDTAGIRESGEEIERMGIARSRNIAKGAGLVLAIFDGSSPLTKEDLEVIEASADAPFRIAVINKSDLSQKIDLQKIGEHFECVCHMSALRGEGIGELARTVSSLPLSDDDGSAGELLTNARQAEAARTAKQCLESCLDALLSGMTPDAALCDAEAALEAIGELTGSSLRDSIVDEIFSRFCVGK